MVRILPFAFLFFIVVCSKSFGQGSSCATADPFCSGVTQPFPASTGVADAGTQACCFTTPNPAYYFLQVANPGNIILDISSSANVDVDFVCWGPFLSMANACANLTGACNGPGVNPGSGNTACSGNVIDCSYSSSSTETIGIPNVQAGQIYVVLITNYANVPTNINFDLNAGSTGTTNCNLINNCSIISITTNASACVPATNNFSLSGVISFLNHPTNSGTITVTEQSSGQVMVINPPFTNNTANYSFSNIASDGSTHSVSAVFSDSTACTFTQTYQAPASCLPCPQTPGNSGPKCEGDSLQLWTDTIAGVTYSWTGPNGFTSTLQNPSITNPTVADAGIYTVTVNGTCGGTGTTSVVINPTPLLSLNSFNLCQQQSDTLEATVNNATAPIVYNWNNGLSNQSSHVLILTDTTVYTCWVQDANGCVSVSDTTVINVFPPLNLIVSGDVSICEGADTIITANGSGGNGGPYVYTWSGGLTGDTINTVLPSATTTYTVTFSDNCSPSVSNSIKVTVVNPPTASFVSDTLAGCDPVPVNFTYTGNGTIANNYYWNFGEGNISFDQNPFHLYHDPGCWNVTLTAYSPGNQCANVYTDTCMIEIYPMPVAEFSVFPDHIDSNSPYANFTNLTTGGISYLWNFNDSSEYSTELNPNHTYADTGTYNVSLITVSNKGCIDTVINKVRVDLAHNIYIPNTFTPDGDNLNDVFMPILSSVPPEEFEMTIFDRWGSIVLKTNDYKEGWNGGFKNGGTKCQSGVYQYKVTYKPKEKQPQYYVGNVNLLK